MQHKVNTPKGEDELESQTTQQCNDKLVSQNVDFESLWSGIYSANQQVTSSSFRQSILK